MNRLGKIHLIGMTAAIVLMTSANSLVAVEPTSPIAITNVTVFSELSGRLDGATIVIDNGRIVDVGAGIDIPVDAERIDGTGLIAYPGFIDALSHFGINEEKRSEEERKRAEDVNPDHRQTPLAATRFANRRGIRPELRAIDLYTPKEKDLQEYRRDGFTGALITPRDGILSGTSGLMALSDVPVRRAILSRDVAMHGSFTLGEDGDYPQSLLGIIAQFRQVMLDAGWHAKLEKFARRHPASQTRAATDPALDALQSLLGRAKRLIFEANTANEINRALKLANEFNLDIAISGAKEAWKVVDRIKAERVPLIISLRFDEEPEYGKKKGSKTAAEGSKRGDGESDDKKIDEPLAARKERRRLWEEQVDNTIRLHEAGVAFALTTSGFEKRTEFWKNLRLVMERGLPEEQALAALTSEPARLFGLGDQLGSIRRSHLANLTLMTKPLSDEKAKVRFVFIDGKRFKIEADEKEKKPEGEKDQAEAESKSESSEAENKVAEATSVEQADSGPSWRVELEADRVPATKTGGDVLIRNATIIPVTSPPIRNASVLIQGGKITAIGNVATVPEGITVIDGTGRFVMPGIIDCHSHLGADSINEGTLAITAEVRLRDVLNARSVGLYRALAGGVTAHQVLHGSANPIGGLNAIVKTKYGASAEALLIPDAPPVIKFAMGENVTQANSQRARGKRFPNSRMGVEAVIRTALEAGGQYQAQLDEYENRTRRGEDVAPPRRDLRLEALAGVVSGEITVHSHCYRSDEILRLIATAEEYGFRLGTLQHVLEGYRIAPEIARHGCGASSFSNFWAYKMEAYGAIPHNAALMTDHGVSVSVNSDSPNTIRYLNLEAAKSLRWGGLDETQALSLVTINAARQLQVDHRIGSLEVGKDGDVAIFNGHPLNTLSRCIMTLIEGEVYFEDARPASVEPVDAPTLPGDADMSIPQTPHRAYAIVGATVHPISAPIIENGTVVILEDKIHAVGVDVPIPPGAGVIDGTGRHVYPGLIDAGSSLGLTEIGAIAATRDSSDTPIFAPHLRTASAIHPHSKLIRIARTGGITTALSKPDGDRIAGQSTIIHLDGWTLPDMLVTQDYALHMSIPSLPPREASRSRGRRRGAETTWDKRVKEHEKAMRELEDFFDRAGHYAKVKALAAEDSSITFDVDLSLEAMVPYVRGDKPVIFNANSYKHILETIEFAEKQKLRCVLDGATGAWKLAETLAEKDIPVILSSPLSYPRGEFEPWDSIYRCAGELERAGVRFCFASNGASSAYNLGLQTGMAVAHGLSRDRAEEALTLEAAKILGVADRVGSIETGKQADLIVTTDSPLQASCLVTHMFIDGRPIELTSLHTERYERFKNRPAPILPPQRELRGPRSLTR